jgi:prepilin-type N-terminal cleavage/methylation domain-containing protein
LEQLMRLRNRRPRRHNGGFTLIEAMIAMSILAFGMLATAAMQLHAMKGGASGRNTSEAAVIAQTRMEGLQRETWTNVAPTGGWTTPVSQTGSGQTNLTYLVDWRIVDVFAGSTRSIDVRVTWDEPDRPNRVVAFSSMRFNRELL